MTHTQKMQEEARDELRKKFCPDGAWDTFNMTFEIEKHIDTLVARVVRETEDRMVRKMCDIPNSVIITIVAKDNEDQDAIRKIVTLESISQSSGVALNIIMEEAIRAIIESKVVKKAIENHE
jgi:hypothetical protein